MKKHTAMLLTLLLPFALAACGNPAGDGGNGSTVQNEGNGSTVQSEGNNDITQSEEIRDTDTGPEEDAGWELKAEPETASAEREETEENTKMSEQIYIKVGEATLTAALENNESVNALKELLAEGPLTIPASNYGGFEKVCPLGTGLPDSDSRITTQAGDICLYSSNQIVIFYGSNTWAYTRLGKVTDMDGSELEAVLSGEETEITLSLAPFA